MGDGACASRVLRRIEVVVVARPGSPDEDTAPDVRSTLLEVAPCPGSSALDLGVLGALVAWRSIDPEMATTPAAAPLVAIVSAYIAADDGGDESGAPELTMSSLPSPGAHLLFDEENEYLVQGGAVAGQWDAGACPGVVVVGSSAMLVCRGVEGTRVVWLGAASSD